MKLELNKKQLVNLSQDAQVLPNELTPQVGGGVNTQGCPEPSYNYPNQPGCGVSDPSGFTHMCCLVP
ncbi:hypothetical protein M2404_000798 [Rheinheimera pacifica]|uniref:hypothetical protein n=1 Tax=Rheinheimera pacifica TaxID=173990 RepID=UPI0021692E0F|nr:hypothetical protein [Rheinheimera pacifica]MCS4306475.1 hypothetical protein [Rheinheimera pacifica]